MTHPVDRWVAVGLDCQIEVNSSNPAIVNDTEIVLWRGENDAVKVWQDRCPHRGMRLSYGFVRENQLRCIYHGWTFDSEGQCRKIPAHPGMTPADVICATAYATETHNGIVWVNFSNSPVQPAPQYDLDGEWGPLRSIYVRVSENDAIDGIGNYDFQCEAKVTQYEKNSYLVALETGINLLITTQPVSKNKTGLHVIASHSKGKIADYRHELIRQLIRLRQILEAL